ncbi:metal-dependent hydrolase [Thermococcus sp. ES12]|uniref:metal-dependent hydrolase n=1 Tax=Thermococcus sp. ES12 TaxID=1638246 RepID=UPI00143146C7|nr:metal-dependent hydrolase [Thermococcus sp. ES12]NJE76445.1 metal-dependent hydrolase [Thermococcus sp. ES12]
MMWYTHVVFGVLFYLIAVLFGAPMGLINIGMAALGALMPDIDHPKSYISTKLPGGTVMPRFVEHRGATHTIEAAFLITALVGGLAYWITDSYWPGIAFFIGYISHLFADTLTVSGIKWSRFSSFHPRGKIRTGTRGEGLVLILVTFTTLVLFAYLLLPEETSQNLGWVMLMALIATFAIIGKKLKRLN